MTDIVERLRWFAPGCAPDPLCVEAADEVERLRKECAGWVMANAKLHGEISELKQSLAWATARQQAKVEISEPKGTI